MPDTAALQGQPAAKRTAHSAAPALIPAHLLAQGHLHRAIVTLPQYMCPREQTLHERIVFFDVPSTENAAHHLLGLLAAAWAVDTHDWLDSDLIYNVQRASDLVAEGMGLDESARLFEMGCGGSEGIRYAEPSRIDLFTAPVLKARLQTIIDKLAREGLTP